MVRARAVPRDLRMLRLRVAAFTLLTLLLLALVVRPAGAVEIERVKSPGGIEAWLVQEDTVPLVAMSFAFRDAGSSRDPAGKEGLANLMSGLLDEGAGKLDSATFQNTLEEKAINISFDAGRDGFFGTLQTLAANRDVAFDLLRLAITEPRFDDEAVERIRAQVISGIRSDARDPDAIAGKLFAETLFPGHVYSRPTDGTEASVAAIRKEDLQLFRTQAFGRDRLVISVVGAIDARTLGGLLDRTFGDLPKTAAPLQIADVVPVSGATASATLAIPQTIIRFGGPGLKRDDPDFMAAYVMNHILGGGSFSSRLYQEIREKRGLTYGVGTYLTPYDHAGLFVGGLGTSADKADEAITLIRAELKRMADEGPTEKELADAKAYLTGSYALRFDTSSKIARQLLAIQVDRLGINYVETRNDEINAVTLDQVKAAARRILDAGAPTIVTVGPKAS